MCEKGEEGRREGDRVGESVRKREEEKIKEERSRREEAGLNE